MIDIINQVEPPRFFVRYAAELHLSNSKEFCMLRSIASVTIAALTAVSAQAVSAQEAGPYFEGFYVSGAVSLDTPLDDATRIVFDTNRDGTFEDQVLTTTGSNAFSPGFCSGAARGATAGARCTSDKEDIGYAIRAGYDFRVGSGPLVAGVVVEASSSDAIDFTTAFSTTPASYTTSREIDYSFALRSRAGYSPGDGRGLFYITGGVAYARINHGFSTTNTANAFTINNDDDMRLGVQAGGGAELMLTPNIGIGLEYLYSRYDDDQFFVAVDRGTAGATNPFLLVSGGTNLRPAQTDLELQSFRVTASFHF